MREKSEKKGLHFFFFNAGTMIEWRRDEWCCWGGYLFVSYIFFIIFFLLKGFLVTRKLVFFCCCVNAVR